MPGYILVGDDISREKYIDSFKKDNNIKEIDVTVFVEKLLIEDVRNLIKSLSLRSSTHKLYILKNNITIEAQNALLKNLEELESYNSIIFCTTTLSTLLPTIHSRCFILNFYNKKDSEKQLISSLSLYVNGKISLWEFIDVIEGEKQNNPTLNLLSALRELIIDENFKEKEKAYYLTKRLLQHYSLIEINNVNLRIAMEKILIF